MLNNKCDMEGFENFIAQVDDILWTYVLIAVLLACALLFTFRLRFVQFRMLREMVRLLVRPERKAGNGAEERHISSFQAFVISLASRIGTGNLAGVATAINIGGPGAVFWMWVIALFGSSLAFVESTLAQLYKRRLNDAFIGGPAYYMKYGLRRGWLGIIFAVLMILTFGLSYSSIQSNTICEAWEKAFGIDHVWMGVALTVLSLIIAFGGIHRVARVSSAIVPFMAIVYLLFAVGILAFNFIHIPQVVATIVSHAFGFHQAAGGAIGAAVMQGVKRGLFSNEAGEGSTPHAAATATVSHPVKQGLVQALGVFTDTLLICSCTAFIILLSGADYTAAGGIQLTQDAISSQIGGWGSPLIAVLIWMFAFSSIIGNAYYGEANIRYITGHPAALFAYRVCMGGVVMLGALLTLDTVWAIGDVTMALLTFCNIIAIVPLSGQAVRLLRDYRKQKAEGRDPQFHRSQMPDIADRLDAWE